MEVKEVAQEGKTHEKILDAAREEFLEKGFQNASLRRIVKTAGVTTGAFYRYYPTKEALFEALVKPHADKIIGFLKEGIAEIERLPGEQQTVLMDVTATDYLDQMLDYIYDHYEEFKLLICASGGTAYEDFIHELVTREVEATQHYIKVLRSMGHSVPEIDEGLCHMISSGLFSGIFEMVIHDMKKEDAKKRIALFREFHTGGWEKIMRIQFG